jgi:hypothetical protein
LLVVGVLTATGIVAEVADVIDDNVGVVGVFIICPLPFVF